jgi:hypothetical protein
MWILALDHRDLPFTLPFLDLMFPRPSGFEHFVCLVPNKTIDPVFGCKAGHRFILMFEHASREIDRAADIQRTVGFARQKIDKWRRARREMGPGLRREDGN